MSVRVLRLGSPRLAGEGLRIGTVRRPPRGVPRSEYAVRDYYDVWLPMLAPSAELIAFAKAVRDERDWQSFFRRYRVEMNAPDPRHLLATLAALSQQTDFSVGCYCADETHCHRSALCELLLEHGAALV